MLGKLHLSAQLDLVEQAKQAGIVDLRPGFAEGLRQLGERAGRKRSG